MAELRDEGALGFTDDGRPVVRAGMLRKALQYQRLCGGVLALHEEDPSLSATARCTRARSARCSASPASRSISESTMVARDCALAGYEGGRVHMQHLSRAESVEAVAAAKARGVAGHLRGLPAPPAASPTRRSAALDTRMKMNPPLRTEADRQALIDGLRDGVIDCIATDHAPHARDEKEVPVRAGADGHDRPGDRVRRALHRARRCPACCRWRWSSSG